MAKDTFYFSHDYNARNDIKIKRLMSKHGATGYGVFWILIEDLYNNTNVLPTDYECISYDIRVDEKIVFSVINDFDLFVINDGYFGSYSVERRLNERNEKSIKAKESVLKRWAKCDIHTNVLRSKCDCNTIKESKGKEKKEKESKGEEKKERNTHVSSLSEITPAPNIDFEKLKLFFNANRGNLPELKLLTEPRKKRLSTLQKTYGKELIQIVIEKTRDSDFLQGKTDKGWKASFDWITNPTNFIKIAEDNYLNRNNGKSKTIYEKSNSEIFADISETAKNFRFK